MGNESRIHTLREWVCVLVLVTYSGVKYSFWQSEDISTALNNLVLVGMVRVRVSG